MLTTTVYQPTRAFAGEMDRQDPLRHYRDQFHLPLRANGHPHLYFCGNSLGLQPKITRRYVEQELADWERLGVEGHFHARNPWMPYHEFLTETTARVVGALPSEVVVMNSLTVNLHLLMVSFFRPTPERFKIIIEADAFPSDRYAVTSQLKFHGYDPAEALIELRSKSGHPVIPTEEILEVIEREGDQVALVMLGGVNYYTGQAFAMEKIAAAGHAKGCTVGFDLAHAAGNLHLKLHEWNVDFACWCSYKYLNSGPGGLSGIFVHERHATADLPRFAGWWGHNQDNRFQMPPDFEPMPGAEGWQLSNPPILALAALRASMEIFDEVGMARLREKSERLTGYLEFLIQNRIQSDAMRVITPSDPAQRGCQLSLQTLTPDGRALFDRLTEAGVIADWREPDVIRLAPVPLYNTFTEVWDFVELLREGGN
ncbi:MAG: kynureninase [Bacteroidota bacterium]